MILGEPLQITVMLAEVFDKLGVQYFVGGSLASSIHGIPRATQDVDLVVELQRAHIPLINGSKHHIERLRIFNIKGCQRAEKPKFLGVIFFVKLFG